MQRRYAVLRLSAWFKVFDDQTVNFLTTDGFHATDGIQTNHGEYIKVNTPDDEVFQKGKLYLMTLEELPPLTFDPDKQRPLYSDFIEERRKRDNGDKTIQPGARLFRGIKS